VDVLDEQLVGLDRALDPIAMRASFSELFRAEYPTLGLEVSDCSIDRTYYKPGRSCRIVYRLAGTDRAGQPYEQWLHGLMRRGGSGSSSREHPSQWPGCGFWRPYLHWPQLKLSIFSFPYDPKLPRLGLLLDPEFIRRRIPFDSPVSCHRVKYRPRKSCLLRFTSEDGRVDFYSKSYAGERSRYVHPLMQQLHEASQDTALTIPRPLALVEEVGAVWQSTWAGTPLSRLGSAIDAALGGRVARALAAFHRLDLPPVPLRIGPSVEDVLDSIRENIADIGAHLSDHAAALTRLETMFAARLPQGQFRSTPIHGSFKIAQILFRDDAVAVVDLDSIGHGDPLYDVAEFVASLSFREVDQETIRAFVEVYQAEVTWPVDRERIAWYVAAFLLAKIHAALKSPGDHPDLQGQLTAVHNWLET